MKRSSGRLPDRTSKTAISVPDRLRFLDRTQFHAVLATDSEGHPYASLIAYVLTPDVKSLLFITPRSTQKYRNILKNRRVSLLIDNRSNSEEDYMNAESITILGSAGPVRKGRKRSEFAGILLRKHPALRDVLLSRETALVEVAISKCIHVTYFQGISTWNVEEAE